MKRDSLSIRLLMKLSVFHILLFSLSISLAASDNTAGQEMLKKRLSLNFKNEVFQEVLKSIEVKTDVKFLYMSNVTSNLSKCSINVKNESLSEVLSELCENMGLKYEIDGDFIILKKDDSKINSKDHSGPFERVDPNLKGRIFDETGEPIPGVTILVKGTRMGTISDIDGNFSMEVAEGAILLISFVGYKSVEIAVVNGEPLNIHLEMDIQALDEVVVVGYGTQKKADVTGSIATVKGSELSLKSMSNFDAGIQGMAAGVSVLSQSGKPGAPTSIKIRGANSIQSGTDPLWIIDGMPVYSSPTGLGTSNQNPMSLLNPNDIESIQILKDAAATSIYGSRGSNGIILVTTKSGKGGKGYINLNVSSGFSDLSRKPEDVGYVNSNEWFQVMDQAYQNSFERDFKMTDYYQYAPLAFDKITRTQIDSLNINTNWFDESFRKGSFIDANMSAAKGFEGGSFYVSGNYRSDKGVLNSNQLDRASFRSNLSFDPTSDLTVDVKLNVSYTNNERRDDDLTTITKFSLPWMPVKDPFNPNRYFNPYADANLVAKNDAANRLNNVKQYRALGNLSFTYRLPFVKGLSLKTEFSTDVIQSNIIDWRSRVITLNGNKEPMNSAREEAVTRESINYNFYGTYNKTFNKFSLNTVTGVEIQRSSQESKNLTGTELTGKFPELGIPGGAITLESRLNDERYLMGYFGRVNLKYNDKYIFGVSARRDGSSAFGENNRWGTFLAYSGAWIISQEEFMNSLGKGLFLKLRASYGETGNQSIPNNLQNINYYGKAVYGSRDVASNGTLPSNASSRDLKWETTRSSDIGIDYGFFNDRINGSFGYYHRYIVDMLLDIQLPSSAGIAPNNDTQFEFLSDTDGRVVNKLKANVGNMVNSGFEFEVYTVNIVTPKFKWTSGFNISLNKNVIQNLTPDLDKEGKGLTTEYTISEIGNKRNVWYLADWAGVNSDTGLPYIFALDQDAFATTGKTQRLKTASGSDSLILATRTNIRQNKFVQGKKSSDPTYYGGINNKLEYNGFDLSFFFSFSGGNYILDYDRQVAVYPNDTRLLLKEALTDSWKKPGDQAKYPKLTARRTYKVDGSNLSDFGDENVFHNRELYKADYIRLRTLTFGYTFKPDLLQRMKLQNLRLYVSGNNLWTNTNYPGFDPEGTTNSIGAQILYWNTPIPQLKSFIFGVDIKI